MIPPQACPMCLHTLESIDQMVYCKIAATRRNRFLQAAEIIWTCPFYFSDFLIQLRGSSIPKEKKKLGAGVVHAVAWSI